MSVTLIAEGRRIYLSGDTFSLKEKIKSAGGHWDRDRKMWWVGSQARAEFEVIAASAPTEYVPQPITPSTRALGKAKYRGRTYYVIADGRERYRLTVLDLSIDFWAKKSECEWLKSYLPRELGYGRGHVEVSYTTLGGLRDFIAESRAARSAARRAAGKEIPDGYTVDLEDGNCKRVSECDMPSDGWGGVL